MLQQHLLIFLVQIIKTNLIGNKNRWLNHNILVVHYYLYVVLKLNSCNIIIKIK